MDKAKLLKEVEKAAASDEISRSELFNSFEKGHLKIQGADMGKRLGSAFYYVGAMIILIGLGVLVGENWESLSSAAKILVTLGSGLLSHVIGLLLEYRYKKEHIGRVFLLLSIPLIPAGLHVAFDLAGYVIDSPGVQSLMALVVSMFYLSSYLMFKDTLFAILSIFSLTWLYFSVTNLLFANFAFDNMRFWQYRSLIAGISYLLFGFSISNEKQRDVTSVLYFVGLAMGLGAALSLAIANPNSVFWEAIFPALTFAGIYMSVLVKRKILLVVSCFYLLSYIVSITNKYFTESLGWAFSLVIIGIFVMIVGYIAFYLNQKYLKEK